MSIKSLIRWFIGMVFIVPAFIFGIVMGIVFPPTLLITIIAPFHVIYYWLMNNNKELSEAKEMCLCIPLLGCYMARNCLLFAQGKPTEDF